MNTMLPSGQGPKDRAREERARRLKTETVWSENLYRWCCKFCGNFPHTYYDTAVHDHGATKIDWCECRNKVEPK